MALICTWVTPYSLARSTCRSPPDEYRRRISLTSSSVNLAVFTRSPLANFSGCSRLALRTPSLTRCGYNRAPFASPFAVRPFRVLSRLFSATVPDFRCLTLMHEGLSHRCITTPPGISPTAAAYASRCARYCLLLIVRRPYPSLSFVPIHSTQPLSRLGAAYRLRRCRASSMKRISMSSLF